MTHTAQQAEAINDMLRSIETLIEAAKGLGAEVQVTSLLRRLIGDARGGDALELSIVLTQLDAFEKRRRHTRVELDAIDAAKAIVRRRMAI